MSDQRSICPLLVTEIVPEPAQIIRYRMAFAQKIKYGVDNRTVPSGTIVVRLRQGTTKGKNATFLTIP
ncbi:hypothetical protein niasHT_003168 [Heterodera trifolii]|uniref:Major sperm protein n=1 Tax=Heterodera trifolii TaxID=157864 RepID=A0ABD2M3X4_9BILA